MATAQVSAEIKVAVDGRESVTGLAGDIDNVEDSAKALVTTAATAGASVQKLGASADGAGDEVAGLTKAVDDKTKAIKAGLLVEQSEIELQRQHLAASQADQEARLRAAQAKVDETAATRAQNALAQIEADQLSLVARLKRAEATAIQQATAARREELAAIGPLTAAQAKELQAAENHAKALRVEAAAADQAAQRAGALGTAHRNSAGATDQLSARVTNLSGLLGQMAGALGVAFSFRELVTAAAQMEQLRSGLTAVTGDATKAGKELEYVRIVASRIGADVTEVGRAFLSLSAATKGTAVEGEPTRQVFEAVATAMGKAGKSSAETSNALQALSQMASKGVVQSEELRGQLGEALPGALNAAAKGMGITTAELMKLVEEGKIAASDLFPALAKGLNELYGSAPAAQTLTQELTNIKNAITDMAANIGEAGGLDALKTGAEIAQAAIVGVDMAVVAMGKTIGAVVAAVATRDFSGLKQTFADIEKEANDKLLKAAQHNETLRNSLKNSGDQAVITALAQQELANKTGAVSAAALAGASDFVKLQNGYRIVRESIVEQITAQEKSVIARDAEGKAAIALANVFGTETEQRQAQAAAAAASAAELERLAALKLQELATMQAELKALQEEVAQRGLADEAKSKQMAELEKAIALRQQETDKAVAQAGASRLMAEQSRAEAEAVQDNSGRVDELREAYEKARAKLEELRAAKEAGLATTREFKDAELEAGRAALLYRDALSDQVKAIEAKANAQRGSIDLEASAVQLAMAQQRAIYEVARAKGDEAGAIRAANELRKLEIQLAELSAKAKRAEAEAALATVAAKRAELQASGQLTEVKRLELDAAEKAARVKIKEAEIAEVTAKGLKDLADVHRTLGTEAARAVGGIEAMTGALGRHGQAASTAAAAVQALYDKHRLGTLEESNKAIQDARDTHTGNVAVQQEYIDAEVARLFGENMVGDKLAEEVYQLGVRTEQYFKYGGPTSKEGFAEANAVKKAYERAKAELEARMAKESQKALDSSAEDETPDRPRTTGGRSSGESTSGGRGSSGVRSPGGSSDNAGIAPGYQGLGSSSGSGSGGGGNGVGVSPDGPTFISNVTIPGLGSAQFEFPDSASQQRGTDLLRRLAAAKRTANR